MKSTTLAAAILLALSIGAAEAGAPDVHEVTFTYRGADRSYFEFTPPDLGEAPPIVILLHGSGRRGDSLIEPWRRLATAEKILLVAPNSADPAEWSPINDPAPFIRILLNHVEKTTPFDRSRVYVFGHSGGAVWALQLGLMASTELAAVAAHAGMIPESAMGLIERAKRKTPMFIQVGDRDPYFPVAEVTNTVEKLEAAGFSPQLVVLTKHDHDYYSMSDEIDQAAWNFLKTHSLGDSK